MKKILIFVFLVFCIDSSSAQPNAQKLLRQMVTKANQLKSLSYINTTVAKNMFSEGDTSYYKASSDIILSNGSIKALNQYIMVGKSKFRDVFNNDTLYQVDLNDSIYTVKPKPQQSDIPSALINLLEIVKRNLREQPNMISQKKDTAINGQQCFNILIEQYNRVENGYRNYTFYHIAMDKKNMMPVLFRENSAGVAEKNGHVIGRITAYDLERFSDYRFNRNISAATFYFDKKTFTLPNSQMLANGLTAPQLKLTTPDGIAVENSQFMNKLRLIEFGARIAVQMPLRIL